MSKWKVLTPKTTFPLRTKAVTPHELAIQEKVNFNEIYTWQENNRSKKEKTFTLHDGPPYANGSPHMGHVLNKVLKDFINRYKILKGYRVSYRPGWDCHGLPIELKACKNLLRGTEPRLIRKTAREFAEKTIESQRQSFQRWGVLGDWSRPYLTMDGRYESNQIDVFYRMYEQGCIYRGHKPVYWSPSSHTALAEAELEYKDHNSNSVYVFFPSFFPSLSRFKERFYSLVWTTTPWTLPLNKAICFNRNHSYSLIKLHEKNLDGLLLVGTELLPKLKNHLGSYEIIETLNGSSLVNSTYVNPLYEPEIHRPFLEGSHVTCDEGTGLVHTAPAHGFDDYKVGVEHELDLRCLVDQNGYYMDELNGFKELNVLRNANDEIINRLKSMGNLLAEEPYLHRYPYDWRTNKPVIIRSTKQWFANVEMLRESAINALHNTVKGIPDNAIAYMEEMLSSRTEWCISRQRVWGVPIPVFYHKEDNNEILINLESINHLKELFTKHGSDCWWDLNISELLPPSKKDMAELYLTGTDTMDVWFDSGTSWASVVANEEGVADLYLEGTDQFRGWFQSSLLTSIAVNEKSPYKMLISHGFVLDKEGNKMSKSKGNVITPDEIINKLLLGADAMRLWAFGRDFKKDIPISYSILKETEEFLQKVRNTLRFMIGNLSSFNSDKNLIPYSQLPYFDRYQLHLLYEYFNIVETSYESLNFPKIHHVLFDFVTEKLSALYFDIIKDRLYCDFPDSSSRSSSLTVLYHTLKYLTLSLAPVLPHLTEEVNLHYPLTDKGSIFKVDWPQLPTNWSQPTLGSEFATLVELRHLVNHCLSKGRDDCLIRSFTEAQVTINTNNEKLEDLLISRFEKSHDLGSHGYSLSEFLGVCRVKINTTPLKFNVEDYVFMENDKKIKVDVSMDKLPSDYYKCPRCWTYGNNRSEDALCERCTFAEVRNN